MSGTGFVDVSERIPVTGRDLGKVLRFYDLEYKVFNDALIYDLGCGLSNLGGELAEEGVNCTVIGFDKSEKAIPERSHRPGSTIKVNADLTQIPAPDESADFVL